MELQQQLNTEEDMEMQGHDEEMMMEGVESGTKGIAPGQHKVFEDQLDE